ncbi:MAG: PQQ-binding-like beta-propeller repeat protein, partial [Planctomycetales bacterium]|nr:PQQ-binding-like beta-propeller repeat protein [Planctomycetales bacterium]
MIRRLACRLAALLVLLSPAWAAQAQDSPRLDVFLLPDYQLRQQLDEAHKAIAERRYNDAVRVLGRLLGGSDAGDTEESATVEDYFLELAAEGAAQQSLKAEARRMLSSLPPDGLASYELLYGHQAELLLEAALERGDAESLGEVARKYLHTKAGCQAVMLLGRRHLASGQPLAAALTLSQLNDLPTAAQFEPELSILSATSWLLADSPEHASETLVALKRSSRSAKITFAGKETALFRDDEDAVDWLQTQLGDWRLNATSLEHQWLVYRGDEARNGSTVGSVPLVYERWAVPTPNFPKQQKVLLEEQRQLIKQRVPALPGLHPLVVRHAGVDGASASREVVLTRTPSRLIAVDFQTGERIWFYPPWGQDPESEEVASFAKTTSSADTPEMMRLKQRTWHDAPFGQISSDGERVFFVQDLGLADGNGPPMIVAGGGIIRPNPDRPRSTNELTALELGREGYLVWSVGGVDGGDEPQLADAFFLGPPLPLMDGLYVLAEVKGDVRLVVLDPASGRLVWQQQLCAVDNQAILDDAARRLGGASPSFSDGVLICPTSAGAVIAVDVAKRSLLWGYQYLETPKDRRPSGGF